MDKSLHNKETGITIGVMSLNAKYVLYVERKRIRRVFATFPSINKAEEFIEVIKEFDGGGGNDGDL